MPSHMYILECANGSYYTGSTKDLERRLWQHQNGEGANFTKKRLPVKLVYAEPFDRVEDAFRREKQIQGWSRRKKKALIEGNYDKLVEFSRNYTQYGNPASTDPASASSASVSKASEYNESFPELVEGNMSAPDPASTTRLSSPKSGSASDDCDSKPFPEPVEGNVAATDPASTTRPSSPKSGSASVVNDTPLPEPVEGSSSLADQLAEENRLNALIQANLAKVEILHE